MSAPFDIAAWLAFALPCAAVAIVSTAYFRLRRAHRIARDRIDALEVEAEVADDLIWDLRESEERSRSLVDDQDDLIVRRDADGLVTDVNDAYCRHAGLERGDIVGTDHRFPVLEAGTRVQREGGVLRRDEAVETCAGRRWIEWQDVPVRVVQHGRPETQSVGRDVTARRDAERADALARDVAEAANQAKSRFLAAVTHEIRTPMGGVVGMADLLLDTPLAPEQASYARAVKTSGEALLALIDEILDFSKIEAGHLDLVLAPFAPGPLVEEVLELLAPRAQAKGIELAAHVSVRLPTSLVGDAGRLKQVLLNLVGNAVKFTQRGGVLVRVEPGSAGIVFSVADSGIGIAPEKQALIFNEFEQVDAGPARRFGGTGLGLAISRRIVAGMGGVIGVESAHGRGSTFRFTIALPAGEEMAAPSDAVPPRRVLVASPSVPVSEALAATLSEAGHVVRRARTEEGALAALAERSADIVLVDRGAGRQAFDAVAAAGRRAGLPVIVLLAPAERHELPGYDVAGYLIKPVRAASLHARLAGHAIVEPVIGQTPVSGVRPLDGLRILLAEDNEINAMIASANLAKLGAQVTRAVDGNEAVRLYAAGSFEAVLMDMRMPGLDGPDATREIRAFEHLHGRVRARIVGLTANVQAESREACLAAGMDSVLPKPLDRAALVDRLIAPPLARAS